MKSKSVYRVLFRNQESLYELYARKVGQGTLFAFVEVEEILFGNRGGVLVDPSEEKLKSEFARCGGARTDCSAAPTPNPAR